MEDNLQELNFDQRRVLVVGGSSGIGNGIAQAFRGRGADVHVWGTRASAVDYAAEKGSNLEGLHYAQCDVANSAAVAALQPGFDALDVLVLCQGIVRYGRDEFEPDGFRHVVDVNLNSLMDCAHKFHAMLKQRRGALIIISSLAGFAARIGNPAYAASKAGVARLTEALAEELKDRGVRVNAVLPSILDTPANRADMPDADATRWVPPRSLAAVIAFLLSDDASAVTGACIPVAGRV